MKLSSKAAWRSGRASSMVLKKLTPNRFLVLGRAGMDLNADPPGTEAENAGRFSAALGGSAANIAVGIVRLGGTAALITAVSDDAVGRFTMNALRRFGVETGHIRVVGGEVRNSLAVVETRPVNCQSVIYRQGAADFQLSEADVATIDVSAYGGLIVTGTSLAAEPSRSAARLAIARARDAGVPVIFDVDYRPYSWASAQDAASTCRAAAELSDIVIGNDLEFAVMAEGGDGSALARALSAGMAAIVVYKMGEAGSITWQGARSFKTGIFQVTALKPTGAGDAFMAGFVTGLAQGLDTEASVQRGSAAAAIVVTRVGCAPAMPNSTELSSFMSAHPGPA